MPSPPPSSPSSPPPPQPPPLGLRNTIPAAAVVPIAVAAAVIIGSGLPGETISTALVFPSLLLLAAWSSPAGLALVVRVFLAEAIRLSGLLAEEEE
ncbi:unnamed protein product, partial [Ectocarpus fasciculatus]